MTDALRTCSTLSTVNGGGEGGYASCITHTSDASLAMGVRGDLTSHVLRTRTTDLTEKWRPARVTPHVLRIRLTHRSPWVSGGAYVPRITHTHDGFD